MFFMFCFVCNAILGPHVINALESSYRHILDVDNTQLEIRDRGLRQQQKISKVDNMPCEPREDEAEDLRRTTGVTATELLNLM